MNAEQTYNNCVAAIASGTYDAKDEIVVALWENIKKLAGNLKEVQTLLDSKTREIANLMFQQDVIATRVAASASDTQEARVLLDRISTLQ